MKLPIITVVLASAGFVFAGDTGSMAKGAAASAIVPPVVEKASCLDHSGWFVGGGVDYFFDTEAAYYNGHLGYDFGRKGRFSHALFVEAGWIEYDYSGADLELVPLLLNYKVEMALTESLNFYLGGGVGAAFFDGESAHAKKVDGDDDSGLAWQLFAGLTYCLTDHVELYAGVRYFVTDDFELAGTPVDGIDDFALGGGVRVNF
ncbi:MAG: hypothetical protein AAGC74_00740 [Verrucomicrobiota bacterium]